MTKKAAEALGAATAIGGDGIDLDEQLVFRHKQASKKLRAQGCILLDMARLKVASQYTSKLGELTSRDSTLSTAIAVLMRGVRPHERHVNSISGKTFGGGVHQTFTPIAHLKIMDWILTYAIATFGGLLTYRCVDIGCGLNFPSWVGGIYDSRLSWIGLEVDPNRILLASEIAITVIPELNQLLQRQPHVGLLYADATAFVNLRGSHVCLLWDRALPDEVVYSTYDSLWRSYIHPFLLVQSNCWWKQRSKALRELFHHVQVIGVSQHFKFMGSGSGDTLVIVFVSQPKDASVIHESELIPPLPEASTSVHDVCSSHFRDINDSMSNYEHLRRQVMSEGIQAKSTRARQARKVLTADTLGNLE